MFFCHPEDEAVQKECVVVGGIHVICLQTSFRKLQNQNIYIVCFFFALKKTFVTCSETSPANCPTGGVWKKKSQFVCPFMFI